MNDNHELLILTSVIDDTDSEFDERVTVILPSLDALRTTFKMDPDNLPPGVELLRGETARKFCEKGIRDEMRWQKQQKRKTHTRSGRPV
jgi:hypothetical protein